MAKSSTKAGKGEIQPHERICNLEKSRNTETDWRFASALAANALSAPAQLPDSVDLRADWWAIGDQGRTGSCVGWASTDSVLRYLLVSKGALPKEDRLSPRCTWMASKETDEFRDRPETFMDAAGTSLKAAAEVLRSYGAVPEDVLPFDGTLYRGDPDAFFLNMARLRIAAYFNLGLYLDYWRQWLAAGLPLMVGLVVDSAWSNVGPDGILDAFNPDDTRGGHAVAIVGYRPDGRFIIRNSWGTSWGDKGFAYASENYIRAGFDEDNYGFIL